MRLIYIIILLMMLPEWLLPVQFLIALLKMLQMTRMVKRAMLDPAGWFDKEMAAMGMRRDFEHEKVLVDGLRSYVWEGDDKE